MGCGELVGGLNKNVRTESQRPHSNVAKSATLEWGTLETFVYL